MTSTDNRTAVFYFQLSVTSSAAASSGLSESSPSLQSTVTAMGASTSWSSLMDGAVVPPAHAIHRALCGFPSGKRLTCRRGPGRSNREKGGRARKHGLSVAVKKAAQGEFRNSPRCQPSVLRRRRDDRLCFALVRRWHGSTDSFGLTLFRRVPGRGHALPQSGYGGSRVSLTAHDSSL